jgi:hypothetical protein
MMPWEIMAKSRAEELRREAMQAELVDQVPRRPSRLGAWVSSLLRQLSVARVTIDDPSADEPLWPRLAGYPYGPRPPE